ncbi:hypothetical protein BN1184_AD_00790 [Pantoea ananatis]|nr:hypothetical protein BN1184_AD_00790 [Pantoea ananatis]
MRFTSSPSAQALLPLARDGLCHRLSSEASLSCTWLLMAVNRLSREIAAAAEKPARYRAQKSGKRLHS